MGAPKDKKWMKGDTLKKKGNGKERKGKRKAWLFGGPLIEKETKPETRIHKKEEKNKNKMSLKISEKKWRKEERERKGKRRDRPSELVAHLPVLAEICGFRLLVKHGSHLSRITRYILYSTY